MRYAHTKKIQYAWKPYCKGVAIYYYFMGMSGEVEFFGQIFTDGDLAHV